jgi:PAS domain S-box-containing protein
MGDSNKVNIIGKHPYLAPVNELIFLTDFNGKIIDASSSVTAKLNYQVDKLVKYPFDQLIYYKDIDKWTYFLGEICKSNKQAATEMRIISELGEKYWYRMNLDASTYASNHQVLISLTEIEAEKKNERMLEDSINRFTTVVEDTLTAICITNKQGLYEYVNKGYCKIYGYEREELIGQHFGIVVPEQYKADLNRLHDDFFEKKVEIGGEWTVLNKAGKMFSIIANAAYILGVDGTPKKVTFIMDITGRITAEKTLAKYAKEIENKSLELEKAYQKIRYDIERARQVHMQFFPKDLQTWNDIDIAAYYEPAEQLGGDYYNLINQEDNKVVFYLSDVSGHGIDGAMLNIFLKNTIDNYLTHCKHSNITVSPRNVVTYVLEKYREEDFTGDYFICISLGVFDLETYTFTYTSAGYQNPLLIVSDKGEIEQIELGGLPLSSTIPVELYEHEERELILTPGMSLLFMTDGIIEEEREEEMFGLVPIEEVLRKNFHESPETLKNIIIKELKLFTSNQKSTDDITLVIVKRRLL